MLYCKTDSNNLVENPFSYFNFKIENLKCLKGSCDPTHYHIGEPSIALSKIVEMASTISTGNPKLGTDNRTPQDHLSTSVF